MLDSLTDIFAQTARIHQTVLITGVLFFVMAGIRSLLHDENDSPLFFALAVFFSLGHVAFLSFYPENSPVPNPFENLSIWQWIVALAAPATVILFAAMGAVHLCLYHIRIGLYNLFFGSSLAYFLYLAGGNWPLDARAIIAVIWGLTWFKLELDPAT